MFVLEINLQLSNGVFEGKEIRAEGSPGDAKDAMMLFISAGRISARVRGVLDTRVFHT